MVAVTAAISVGVGLWVLGWLLDRSRRRRRRRRPARPTARDARLVAALVHHPRRRRRGRGGRGRGVGRNLLESGRERAGRDGPPVPPASVTVPPLPADADLSTTIAGLTPIVVPTDQFYRIDTSLLTPSVNTTGWTLRIHGLVDRETILTWEQLIALPMFEQYVTLACVSNEVGGNLIGNAKWTGVRLREVLDIAGVQPSATQLVGRSVDGWTAGMPTAWVMDPAREPMIALKMNDEPLPPDPRLPGPPHRAGAVRLRVGDQVAQGARADDARGVQRLLGPAGLGEGRPDPDPVPDRHAARRRRRGQVPIAGIAWAPDRGISRVEVAIDGVWRDARLSTPISDATWVQWVTDWAATPAAT